MGGVVWAVLCIVVSLCPFLYNQTLSTFLRPGSQKRAS